MNKEHNNTLLVILAILIAVLLFGGFGYRMMGYGNYGGMWGMMSGNYGYGPGWIFGWLLNIVILVAVVLLIIWLIKQIQGRSK